MVIEKTKSSLQIMHVEETRIAVDERVLDQFREASPSRTSATVRYRVENRAK